MLAASWSAAAFSLVPGDLYSSNYSSLTIQHHDRNGSLLDSLTLPSSYGMELKGMAFGPQGWLYAVAATSNFGTAVYAFDSSGGLRESYASNNYVYGNLSYGKIAFGNDGRFYVAGQDQLMAFTPGMANPSVIYTNNQVFDVEALPSGNLLVLSAYELKEITPSGQVVRSIGPNGGWLTDARGVEYDPVSHDIFVSMLGSSNNFFSVMRLDSSTGQVEASTNLWYADDLLLTDDGRLVVGSRMLAPTIFDLNLHPIGTFNGGQQMFVAQMPVPEPAAAVLLLLGLPLLAWRRRNAARSD